MLLSSFVLSALPLAFAIPTTTDDHPRRILSRQAMDSYPGKRCESKEYEVLITQRLFLGINWQYAIKECTTDQLNALTSTVQGTEDLLNYALSGYILKSTRYRGQGPNMKLQVGQQDKLRVAEVLPLHQ